MIAAQVAMTPERLHLMVGPQGDPLIIGEDSEGNKVAIEVRANFWPQFVTNAGRLRGIGIVPAGMGGVTVVEGDSPELERELRNGGDNGAG